MSNRVLALRASLIIGAVVVLVGCGSSGSSSSASSSTGSTNSAATSTPSSSGPGSGDVVVYGNPPPAQFKPLVDAFSKSYPNIKVSYSDLEDAVAFSKYRAEAAQGARTADIIIASAPNQWDSNKDIALDWTPTDASQYPSYLKQYPGVFILSPDPTVSIWNKARLPSNRVPTTFAQLQSYLTKYPDLFKGKLATYTVNNLFGYSAFWGLVQKKGWSLLDALGPASKPAADGTALAQELVTGAANFGYFESGLIRGGLTGALTKLIGIEYMHDFTPLIPRGIAVTKGGKNPSGAKTFVTWLYSAAGQQVMCAAGFTAYRTGVNCPNSLASVQQAAGGAANTFLVPLHSSIATDEPSFSARWHHVFG
jgi:iron(III) transport system substrate-binding protein